MNKSSGPSTYCLTLKTKNIKTSTVYIYRIVFRAISCTHCYRRGYILQFLRAYKILVLITALVTVNLAKSGLLFLLFRSSPQVLKSGHVFSRLLPYFILMLHSPIAQRLQYAM